MKKIYTVIIALLLLAHGSGFADVFDKSSDDVSQKRTPRIIGGEEASPGAYPWIAALVNADQDAYYGQFCAGTLIHPRWVVTAAHCVKRRCSEVDEDVKEIDVMLGVHDLENDIGERVKVKRIVSHPSYDYYSHNFDIALLELEKDVSYAALPLVDKNADLDGKDAIIIGWGSIQPCRYDPPAALQQVSVPIVSNYKCNEAYNTVCNPFLYKYPITEYMMCAGYGDEEKDSCYGDSGGPIMIKEGDTWKLAGIVSWGEGCAQPGLYGVYARISKFVDFINETQTAAIVFGKLTTSFAGHEDLDVANAEIEIKGTSFKATSDEYGRFSVEIPSNQISPITYTASIKASGLLAITKNFTLQAGQSVDLSTHISAIPFGDFNQDGKAGLEDIISILQTIAGMRP